MSNKLAENRIGLLATGNELTEGDILNTNGQAMARLLADHGLPIGMHLMVADQQQDIVAALEFLLQQHSTVIITGGLGPTTDDLTRYALSSVIEQPLLFDETAWQNILARLQKIGIKVMVDAGNRQQALFPAGATVLPNPNGTAAGCRVMHSDKNLYMLPGPPNECLPMFKDQVLPDLLALQTHRIQKLKWRIFGVSEGEIANQVEAIVKGHAVTTGYRMEYPYLEVKLYAATATLLTELEEKLNSVFSQYTLAALDKNASELLREALGHFAHPVIIEDHATHGQLQAKLINPATYNKLLFKSLLKAPDSALKILISGLEEFWQDQPLGQATLNLQLSYQKQQESITIRVPYRSASVVCYAIEFIAREILIFIEVLRTR